MVNRHENTSDEYGFRMKTKYAWGVHKSCVRSGLRRGWDAWSL